MIIITSLIMDDERCWMMVDDGEKAVAVPARRLSAAKVLERNLMMIDDVCNNIMAPLRRCYKPVVYDCNGIEEQWMERSDGVEARGGELMAKIEQKEEDTVEQGRVKEHVLRHCCAYFLCGDELGGQTSI
jgi:hypothetical protein